MAYSQTQIDAIESALATGALTVTFSDGNSVTYRSVRELERTLAMMKKSVSGSQTTTFTPSFSSGL
jgi:hypothetical protein